MRKGACQAETAVRTVLEAKATRMPAEKVSKTEYHHLTMEEIRASGQRKTKVVTRGKKSARSGPMCIAGRPPPPEPSQGAAYREEFM